MSSTVAYGNALWTLSQECLEGVVRRFKSGDLKPGCWIENCTTPEHVLLRIADYSRVCRVRVGLPNITGWGGKKTAQEVADEGIVGLYLVRMNHPDETPYDLETELEFVKNYSLPFVKGPDTHLTNCKDSEADRRIDAHEAVSGWRPFVTDPASSQSHSGASLKKMGSVGLRCPSSLDLRGEDLVELERVCSCGGPDGHVPGGMYCREGL